MQQSISEEVNHLLWEYFSAMSNSIAFTELVIPAIIHFKRLMKQERSILTKPLSQLVEKVMLFLNLARGKRFLH